MTEPRRRAGRMRPRPRPPAAPAEQPTPSEPPAHGPKSFLSNHKTAVGAVLSFAAAVASTLLVTFVQIGAEDNRAAVEFTRTQRQEAYVKLIADEYQLRRLEDEFRDMVAASGPAAEMSAQRVKVDDAYLAFKADVGSVTLVGSNEAAAKAWVIDVEHSLTRDDIDDADKTISKNLFDKKAADKFVSNYKYPAEHGDDRAGKMLQFVCTLGWTYLSRSKLRSRGPATLRFSSRSGCS